jgi:flagellar protein FliT
MVNDYLQISAQLYKHLTTVPVGEERSEYIKKINDLLDQRGEAINALQQSDFKYDENNNIHQTLFELDKGIQLRLKLVMDEVKNDIKELNNTKKNERHYIDPYEDLRTIEGRYYDGKK